MRAYKADSFVGSGTHRSSCHLLGNAHKVLVFEHLNDFIRLASSACGGASDARIIAELNKQPPELLPRTFFRSSAVSGLCATYSQNVTRVITAFVYLDRQTKQVSARFFLRGREVKRCGSGSLAVAGVLWGREGLHVDQKKIQVNTPAGRVYIGRALAKTFYYETPVLPYFHVLPAQYRAWQLLINSPVRWVTLVGGSADYCIVELPDQAALTRCVVNAQALTRYSARALIVTAKSSVRNIDYVVRYFSPQYGQYEDQATGSANAMLANFWQQRLGKKSIRGRQLSSGGGEFNVVRFGHKQRVFGRVSVGKSS